MGISESFLIASSLLVKKDIGVGSWRWMLRRQKYKVFSCEDEEDHELAEYCMTSRNRRRGVHLGFMVINLFYRGKSTNPPLRNDSEEWV